MFAIYLSIFCNLLRIIRITFRIVHISIMWKYFNYCVNCWKVCWKVSFRK